jgi:hypothetical protein
MVLISHAVSMAFFLSNMTEAWFIHPRGLGRNDGLSN